MGTITVYDSEGYKYENGQRTAQQSSEMQDALLAQMRVRVDTDRRKPELICYFRARETQGGRAEQFYAHYQADRLDSIFDDFHRELIELVENRWGMSLDTTSNDTEAFRLLTQVSGQSDDRLPGNEFRHQVIQQRLEQNSRLTFGVNDVRTAMEMLKSYLGRDGVESIVITEQLNEGLFQSVDLVLKPDGSRGLAPLGNTKRELETGRREMEDRLLRNTVQNVKSDVQKLKDHTSLSDREIRDRIHTSVPTLKPPEPTGMRDGQPGVGAGSGTARTDDDGSIPWMPLGLAALVLIIGAVVVGAAIFFGLVSVPFIDAASQQQSSAEITVTGDDGPEQLIVNADGLDENDTASLSIDQPNGESETVTVQGSETAIELSEHNITASGIYELELEGDEGMSFNHTISDQDGNVATGSEVGILFEPRFGTDGGKLSHGNETQYWATSDSEIELTGRDSYDIDVNVTVDGATENVTDDETPGEYSFTIDQFGQSDVNITETLEYGGQQLQTDTELDVYVLDGEPEFIEVTYRNNTVRAEFLSPSAPEISRQSISVLDGNETEVQQLEDITLESNTDGNVTLYNLEVENIQEEDAVTLQVEIDGTDYPERIERDQ